MEHLFFNLTGSRDEVFARFFRSIGVPHFREGDSANVLGGIYGSASLFGMKIKIEENSYDFEEDYSYMVSIREDMRLQLKVDPSLVQKVASIVGKLLTDNESIVVAQEAPSGGLMIVHQQEV